MMVIPHLSIAALCGVVSVPLASWMGAYFGEAAGGAAAFLAFWLLLIGCVSVRPKGREVALNALLAGFFGAMRVMGHSFDATDSYEMILKNADTLHCALLATIALTVGAFCALSIVYAAMDRLADRPAEAADATGKRKLLLICGALIFAGSVPYLMIYAPGLNIFDTHDQILQFFGFPSYIGDGRALSDHHPVFLTVVYGLFMKLGLLFGDANVGQMAYSVLSMAAIAAGFAFALGTLLDAGLSRRGVLGIALGVALYPVLALYAFNMAKDVSAAPFVLLMIGQMLALERTRGAAMRDNRFAAAVFLTFMGLMLTRKPSVFTLAFALPFLLARWRAGRLRLAAVTLGALLLFQVGYTHLLLPALHVVPGESREMLSIPMQQVARVMNRHEGDLTEREEKAFARVLDLSAVKDYDPRLSDPIKDTSNPSMTASDTRAFMSSWLTLGIRHPTTYLQAWLNMIYGYFYPSVGDEVIRIALHSPDEAGVILRQDAAREETRLHVDRAIHEEMRSLPGVGSLFHVDAVVWIFLALLVYLWRRDGAGAMCPFMFFVGTLGICMLSSRSGEIRNLLPILYALPVMAGWAIRPRGSGANG